MNFTAGPLGVCDFIHLSKTTTFVLWTACVFRIEPHDKTRRIERIKAARQRHVLRRTKREDAAVSERRVGEIERWNTEDSGIGELIFRKRELDTQVKKLISGFFVVLPFDAIV